MIGKLNLKTKRVLIGWLTNTVKETANQDAYLKVQHFYFNVKVVCHFRV